MKLFFKMMGVFAGLLVSVILLAFLMLSYRPKPSVTQLKKACGVRLPSFTIIDRTEATGNHTNYYYTVHFIKDLDKSVLDQIEYQCKYGKKLDGGIEFYMPWTNKDGRYEFYVDATFDIGDYRLPLNCRSIGLSIGKESSLMTIHYTMED